MYNILKYCKLVGTKDMPQGHDWSLYLRSITRVCMGWLNTMEIIEGTHHTEYPPPLDMRL